VAAAEATKEIVWLRKILEDLQEKQVNATPLLIDNILQSSWRRILDSMIEQSARKRKV
jgi:hypothetical protein